MGFWVGGWMWPLPAQMLCSDAMLRCYAGCRMGPGQEARLFWAFRWVVGCGRYLLRSASARLTDSAARGSQVKTGQESFSQESLSNPRRVYPRRFGLRRVYPRRACNRRAYPRRIYPRRVCPIPRDFVPGECHTTKEPVGRELAF